MQIYLASPFFNEKEIKKLSAAEEILRSKGLDVYSPREHEDRTQTRTAEWSANVFKMDIDAIDNADMVVMLYHGNYSDSGTAWECGYAFAKGKPCVVVHFGEPSNLMVHEGSHTNLMGLEELRTYDFSTAQKYKFEGKMF